MQFLGYLKDCKLSCEASTDIMKTLIGFKDYKIAHAPWVKFDNMFFIEQFKTYIKNGVPYSLKSADSYKESLINLIKIYCKFGDEHFE